MNEARLREIEGQIADIISLDSHVPNYEIARNMMSLCMEIRRLQNIHSRGKGDITVIKKEVKAIRKQFEWGNNLTNDDIGILLNEIERLDDEAKNFEKNMLSLLGSRS